MSLRRFDGKVVVVTGATAGIGAEAARRLVAEGAQVVITGRSAERGKAMQEELGDTAMFVGADQRDETAADLIVDAAVSRHGRLDVLVNNAAVDHTGDVLETSPADVRELFEINTFAPLRMLQAAGRVMRDNGGGAIVNVSSRLASIGVPTMAVYSATKGAILALTRGAAIDLAPLGIRVNAVAPGMTRTPLFDEWIASQDDPAAVARETAAKVPQGRLGTSEDVAAAIAYLASDEAAHVTGASLPVDGGYTAA